MDNFATIKSSSGYALRRINIVDSIQSLSNGKRCKLNHQLGNIPGDMIHMKRVNDQASAQKRLMSLRPTTKNKTEEISTIPLTRLNHNLRTDTRCMFPTIDLLEKLPKSQIKRCKSKSARPFPNESKVDMSVARLENGSVLMHRRCELLKRPSHLIPLDFELAKVKQYIEKYENRILPVAPPPSEDDEY